MADTPASSSDLDSGDRTHINLGGTRGGGAKWHGRPRNTEPTKTKKDRQSALKAALANASKESSAFFEMFTAQMAAAEKAREERDERAREREEREREREREHQRWMFSLMMTGKAPEPAPPNE